MTSTRRARWAVLLRSFAIQGSFNYRTLIGAGFAFALMPVLRVIHHGDKAALAEAVRRHGQVFNSHPYLAPMALGAVARLEEEGRDEVVIDRFKRAVRGSLGTLGDRVFWAGWKPVCILAALGGVAMGAPWWAVVGGFLVVYNGGHLAVRVSGYRLGLEHGIQLGERLRTYPLGKIQRALTTTAAFLVGVVVALAVGRGILPVEGGSPTDVLPWPLASAAAAAAGVLLAARLRTPLALLLAGTLALGIALGI